MAESCLTDACFFWNKSSVLKSISVRSSYRSWMRSIPRRPKPVISRQEVLGHCSSWPTRHKLSNYGEKVCHVSSQHLIFTLCLYLFYEKKNTFEKAQGNGDSSAEEPDLFTFHHRSEPGTLHLEERKNPGPRHMAPGKPHSQTSNSVTYFTP